MQVHQNRFEQRTQFSDGAFPHLCFSLWLNLNYFFFSFVLVECISAGEYCNHSQVCADRNNRPETTGVVPLVCFVVWDIAGR